jgi:transcription initiation factor IIE alpha subunit
MLKLNNYNKETIMKRYYLTCPKCGEYSVLLPAGQPEEPYCSECDEVIEIEEVKKIVENWAEFISDLESLPPYEDPDPPVTPQQEND